MPAGPVVVHLDPLERGFRHRFQVRPRPGVDEFLLVRREETLRDRIVVTDTRPAQRTADLVLLAVLREIVRRILCPAIGTKPNSA